MKRAAIQTIIVLITALVLPPLAALHAAGRQPRVFHAQGELAGEVTQTTVILQSRLTGTTGLEDGDVLNTENSRLGRVPGDPRSTDPHAKVRQRYTDAKPTGGYLLVEVTPPKPSEPARLRFSIQDEWGKELYCETKTASPSQTAGPR